MILTLPDSAQISILYNGILPVTKQRNGAPIFMHNKLYKIRINNKPTITSKKSDAKLTAS
jgi:hypothetical protein